MVTNVIQRASNWTVYSAPHDTTDKLSNLLHAKGPQVSTPATLKLALLRTALLYHPSKAELMTATGRAVQFMSAKSLRRCRRVASAQCRRLAT